MEVGRVLDAWGVKGWVKVQSFASDPQALLEARRVVPLLLLDDVMSELDPGRRERLVGRLGDGGQVLITAADDSGAEDLANGLLVADRALNKGKNKRAIKKVFKARGLTL